MSHPIHRTFAISNITAEELATIFANMPDEDQAIFFSKVGEIAATWPGAGWCRQCCAISEHLDKRATETILKLSEWAAEPYVRRTPTGETHHG